MFKKTVALTLLLTFLVGCGTSASRLNNLSIGMNKSEVVQILGTPQSVKARPGQEVLWYTLGNSWNSTAWNSQYYVMLQNGKIVSYGHAQ